MKYNSIVPSEMTKPELQQMCGDIQTAKNWGLPFATVSLSNGNSYRVDVHRHKDYQRELSIYTGRTLVSFYSHRPVIKP